MLSFSPRDVLDGILNLTESVSEDLPTYSCKIDSKLVEAPSNFIPGRPKAGLLFWFFCDFRYGAFITPCKLK